MRGRPPPSPSLRACVLFQRAQCPPTAASSCSFQSHSAGCHASPDSSNPDTLHGVLQAVSSGPRGPGPGPRPRRTPLSSLRVSPLCVPPTVSLSLLCPPSVSLPIPLWVSLSLFGFPSCSPPTPFLPSLADPKGPFLCPVGVQPGSKGAEPPLCGLRRPLKGTGLQANTLANAALRAGLSTSGHPKHSLPTCHKCWPGGCRKGLQAGPWPCLPDADPLRGTGSQGLAGIEQL